MTMNINGTQSSYPHTSSMKLESIRSGSLPDKPVSEVDPVKLTPSSQAMRQMEANLGPEVDEAQVARIRRSIEEGTYSANPQKIAERLVDLESEIFRPRGR